MRTNTAARWVVILGLTGCSTNVESIADEPAIDIPDIPMLGAADAPDFLQGELPLGETQTGVLTLLNRNHLWRLNVDTTSSIELDLSSVDTEYLYLTVYHPYEQTFNCSERRRPCLEVELPAGSHIVYVTSFEALVGLDDTLHQEYELTARRPGTAPAPTADNINKGLLTLGETQMGVLTSLDRTQRWQLNVETQRTITLYAGSYDTDYFYLTFYYRGYGVTEVCTPHRTCLEAEVSPGSYVIDVTSLEALSGDDTLHQEYELTAY